MLVTGWYYLDVITWMNYLDVSNWIFTLNPRYYTLDSMRIPKSTTNNHCITRAWLWLCSTNNNVMMKLYNYKYNPHITKLYTICIYTCITICIDMYNYILYVYTCYMNNYMYKHAICTTICKTCYMYNYMYRHDICITICIDINSQLYRQLLQTNSII